jgi:hypothetical protein
VGFVADKVALGKVLSEHCGVPLSQSFHHTFIYHRRHNLAIDSFVI